MPPQINVPQGEQDETRLCPTCRMPISILATRCRHCGEEVGRPRKEQAELSVQDLGGEEHVTYTVSSNVMEALESFRSETLTVQEIERRRKEEKAGTWFGNKKDSELEDLEKKLESGIPGLEPDERSRDLLEASTGAVGTATPPARKPAPRTPVVTTKLFTFGAIVAGLILLAIGTSFAWARISDYLERVNAGDAPICNNEALALLDESTIDALQAAAEALDCEDTEANREIAEQVRSRFEEEVVALLDAVPFSDQELKRASGLANRAFRLDKSLVIKKLKGKADREVQYHKMLLTSIDTQRQTATFKLHNAHYTKQETQTVSVSDYLQDRFIVTRIGRRDVSLTDQEIKDKFGQGRKLRAMQNVPVTGDRS